MKRPSLQFYPADWKNNANLRRCCEAARGAWMDVICLLHDSDEYGVLRWPLGDIAQAAGITMKSANEIVAKGVLKGGNLGIQPFTFTPRHAGKDGDTVILIQKCSGPCWFSSRMVVDEWIRKQRGSSSRFSESNTPKPPPKPPFGDGPTSSSSSSSTTDKDDKACSTKEKKLSPTQKEQADRIESLLGIEWVNDAGKWINLIKSELPRAVRIINELENAVKEERIKTTPARYAQQIMKEFK